MSRREARRDRVSRRTSAARSAVSSAFGCVGKLLEEVVGEQEVEHRVAQVLEPLVIFPVDIRVLVQVRAMRERGSQEAAVPERQPVATGKLVQNLVDALHFAPSWSVRARV